MKECSEDPLSSISSSPRKEGPLSVIPGDLLPFILVEGTGDVLRRYDTCGADLKGLFFLAFDRENQKPFAGMLLGWNGTRVKGKRGGKRFQVQKNLYFVFFSPNPSKAFLTALERFLGSTPPREAYKKRAGGRETIRRDGNGRHNGIGVIDLNDSGSEREGCSRANLATVCGERNTLRLLASEVGSKDRVLLLDGWWRGAVIRILDLEGTNVSVWKERDRAEAILAGDTLGVRVFTEKPAEVLEDLFYYQSGIVSR